MTNYSYSCFKILLKIYIFEILFQAIREKDFDTFASLTMRDSDNFHAICLDTFPPCVYMNDVSHAAVGLIHKINEVYGGLESNDGSKMLACYTFDAGPNACIFLREEHVSLVASFLEHFFPPSTGAVIKLSESTGTTGLGDEAGYIRGERVEPTQPSTEMLKKFEGITPLAPGSLKYIIHTSIGNGPNTLPEDGPHLLDIVTGLPKFLSK